MTFVVAEVGNTHNGDPKLAQDLIRMCAAAGVDAVKTQRRHLEACYTQALLDEPYAGEHSYGATYGEHRAALELAVEDQARLRDLAHDLGLQFGVTPFDLPSLDDVVGLEADFVKVASSHATDLDFVAACLSSLRPVLVSTGGCEWEDVEALYEMGADYDLTLLQCTAMYPCPAEHLDLGVIARMVSCFPLARIGFSSHFNGISMPLCAAALGAEVIEVHVTLDRTLKGTDHSFSLEPPGLRKLVRDIRRLTAASGSVKRLYDQELQALRKMRRSLMPGFCDV